MAPPTTRPFWQTFLFFLLPLMAANILQSLSGTINNIFLGQLIGVRALAAASVFFPIMFLFVSFLIGISAGASVLIGQAHGARDHDKVQAVTGTTLTVALGGGLVIGILASIFADRLMALLGTPADIFDEAVTFARVSFLSMPVMFTFFIASSVLRGVGDTVTPLYSLIVSTVVSAALTPAFITGWGPFPALGIVSPAVAGMIAFFISLVALAFYLRFTRHPMAPDAALARHLVPDLGILGKVLKLGVPTGIQMITGALAGIVIIGLVNKFGSEATASYGAVNQVLSYVQFPAISIAIAASIFGAQKIGAGKMDELRIVTRTALLMNLFLTGTLILIVYLASEHIVRLFITDPDIVALSQRLLHIVTWSSLLFGAGAVFAGIMRASGTVIMPMVISIFAIIAIEVPTAIFLSSRIGITGIWWGFVASFSSVLVMQFLYYWFVWRKREIKALV